MSWKYTYKAVCTRVVDGDTVDLRIDLGLGITIQRRIRLYGVDAPEIFGVHKLSDEYEQGEITTLWLKEQIEGKEIQIQTFKDRKGKFGRYLATLYRDGVNINTKMVEEGFAQKYNA